MSKKKNEVKVWKCRCEAAFDYAKFMRNNIRDIPKFTVEFDGFCGATLEFETVMCRCQIVERLEQLSNLHVMVESLQPVEKYTGERIR
jgi:hypothetical protein